LIIFLNVENPEKDEIKNIYKENSRVVFFIVASSRLTKDNKKNQLKLLISRVIDCLLDKLEAHFLKAWR